MAIEKRVKLDIIEVNGRTFEGVKFLGMVPESIEPDDFNIYVRWEANGTIRADRSDNDRMIVAAHVGKGGKGAAFAQLMENLATLYGVPVVVTCDPGVSGGQSGKMVGEYLPREVKATPVTVEEIEAAYQVTKRNRRVFVAEAHNFGRPAAFIQAVSDGLLTLVGDGAHDMSRYVLTRRTADGVVITHGLPVWDGNLEAGTVDLTSIDSDGWFNVRTVKGGRSLMNAERICTRHPFTGVSADEMTGRTWADVVADDATKLATVEIHTGDGTVITTDDVKARVREAFKPVEPIPANPEPFSDRDMRDQIVAYLGSDVDGFYVDGIVDHLIKTHNGAVNIDDVDAGSWHGTLALFLKPSDAASVKELAEIALLPDCCNECEWDAPERLVWSGTGTLIKPSIRTNLGKRKRKATRKARRAVKGGF